MTRAFGLAWYLYHRCRGLLGVARLQSSVKQATGAFPLDSKLLRDNAFIAATYMCAGRNTWICFSPASYPGDTDQRGSHCRRHCARTTGGCGRKSSGKRHRYLICSALLMRRRTSSSEDAKPLQSLIDAGAPPLTEPCQIIIGGPIGSGRTSMAAGIGTEFAFKQNKVRYLGLDCLLEFATNATEHVFPDDAGPATISYWPWSQAQVVIIDGVGPFVASNEPGREANVARFKTMLQNDWEPLPAF